MKQITDDYVSYEIAQLLKEKGFDEPYCNCYLLLDEGGYTEVEMSDECHQGERYDSESSSWKFGTLLLRPTHQMALKWLREVYKIHINFDIHWLHFANQNGWMYVIERILDNGVDYIDSKGDENDSTFFSTYEQAVEAALLYVLKNLI